MKNKVFIYLIFCLSLYMFGCSNEFPVPTDFALDDVSSSSLRVNGATQVSGIGYFDVSDNCGSAAEGATYALEMKGDLEGCLFIFIDEYKCNSSGAYYEEGRELFIGTYKGEYGEFWTNYKFTAKYEGCNEDGSYKGLEIFGRCQHPILKGSGLGVFTGVTGRLDIKDDIDEGNYPYRGHFKF